MRNSSKRSLESILNQYQLIGEGMFNESSTSSAAKYNRLFKKRLDVLASLDEAYPDSRACLKPFLTHPNLQVRLNAAYDLYDVDPQAALAAFRSIVASGVLPQAANASLALERRDPTFKG